MTNLSASRSPDLSALGTTMTVWAHPDDETYLSGGLSSALRDAGHRVVCVTATRGEAGGPVADAGARARLAELRTRELADALGVLGVEEHVWLDHPDGGCAAVDEEVAVGQLLDVLDDVRPDTLVTFGPDGFTGHRDHRTVSRWVDLALRRSAARPRLLHAVSTAGELSVDPALNNDFGVFSEGWPRICDPDELVVHLELSGAELQRKVEALRRQHSQTGGLVDAVGLERFTAWVVFESFAAPAARSADDLAAR
ncbi:MAG TPA: PIG-L family deacetylase [Nocardioidaceae bacterium]|nr:PIG-L family deacetylase [Nocardioidaceae bacterium]